MEKSNNTKKFKNSTSLKLAIIIALSLLMLIPTLFVRSLIDERQNRRNETLNEVASKWGQEQILAGPILIIPYHRDDQTHYHHILPDELTISGEIEPKMRYRGIYKVPTYSSKIRIHGKFLPASIQHWKNQTKNIYWNQTKLVVGIEDLIGLDELNSFTWNEDSLSPEGGISGRSSIESGIQCNIKYDPEKDNSFIIDINLNGSESLKFIPAGKSTKVCLSSTWPDPSFDGAALPDKREITNDGFLAEWNSLHLTRDFPQEWDDEDQQYTLPKSAYGVSLHVPVDIYQKSTRAVKYAFMFIGLTFLVIFFIEVFSKQRIHPVQYLLTGAALVVFYSLLISLSEHMNFSIAYIAAGTSTIAMISFYTASFFKQKRYTIITVSVLLLLYTFLYVILHMSDMALLVGNIGLFLILAFVMFFSRKIEWYSQSKE